ncbi:MAG: type II CAAX endopeptidase family protein [Candidatus Bathyarchaeia archaeon]
MELEKSPVSPLIAVLVVIVTFLLSMFLGAALLILFGTYFMLLFGEILIIIVPLGYMLYKKVDIGSYIGFNLKPKIILLGLTLGVGLFLLDIIVSAVLVFVFGESEAMVEANNLLRDMSASPQGLVMVIVALLLAGICEEFTFRGFLQTAINSRYPAVVALLVSSLAFGLFHFDPQGIYILSTFILGLLLGYIYHRWRSYVVSSIAHATVNLMALALLLLVV